ncbi:MAG TPA: diguanylate cyclase, partial [Planctomycetota bacterium]|nr:diguanylate cyclase [Planctomycetota bacterium]
MAGLEPQGAGTPVRLLHVEPDDTEAACLHEMLMRSGRIACQVTRVPDIPEARRRALREVSDVVLVGLRGPEAQGIDPLRGLAAQVPGVPILVVTDLEGEALAHAAVQKGAAQDYLVREELAPDLLEQAVLYARERSRMQAAVRALRKRESPPSCFDRLTQLPNRQTFYDRLGEALTEARPQNRMVAVLLLGLEGFKLVHNTLGPSIGDPLMQAIASRLLESLPGLRPG